MSAMTLKFDRVDSPTYDKQSSAGDVNDTDIPLMYSKIPFLRAYKGTSAGDSVVGRHWHLTNETGHSI